MKNVLLLCLLFLSMAIKAQMAGGKFSGSDGTSKLYEFYDNNGNRIQTADQADVNGTPMLKNIWGNGVVKFKNGKQFIDSSMNFSLFESKLFFKKANKIFVVPDVAEEFRITFKNEDQSDEKVYFKCGYPGVDKNDLNTYYQVLYFGNNLQLLKWQHKKIVESSSYGGVKEKNFVLEQAFYVFDSKNYKTIPIEKKLIDLKKALPDYATDLDEYLAKHKVNTKSDKDMLDLVTSIDKK